tara:strand:+ start:656 stop:1375 length:720 start_codon:yes stop_codon:yes gene_type:complete
MKKLFDATAVEYCKFELHKDVWGDAITIINARFKEPIPRVVFIKSVGKNNFNISQVGKTKRFKSLSIQDIYPFGSSFNINDTHIDIPVGSYLTYDENNVHGCYYKNKIIESNGYKLTGFSIGDDGLYFNDIKIFDNYTFSDFNDGFYNFSGQVHIHKDKDAKDEFSKIQEHIFEPKTILQKDKEGHFVFVGKGEITVEYLNDAQETTTHTFKEGSMIYPNNKEIKILSGKDFHAYEFYK